MCALGWCAACVFVAGRVGPGIVESLASPWSVQCWGLLVLVTPIAWILGRRRTAWALAVPLAWATVTVGPGLRPARSPELAEAAGAAPTPLRIACANVHARNAPTPGSVKWLAESGADIVALLECSDAWVGALGAAGSDSSTGWPHVASRTDGRAIEGVALFSRHPIIRWRAARAPVGAMPHIDAVIDLPGGPVRVLVVHPIPPEGIMARDMRNAELEWIASQCREGDAPTVVIGDFNETPWGRAFADFAGSSGLVPASAEAGWTPTWPVRLGGIPIPAPLRIPIDHAFVSPSIGVRGFRTGPDIGSDHLPIVLDISRPGS